MGRTVAPRRRTGSALALGLVGAAILAFAGCEDAPEAKLPLSEPAPKTTPRAAAPAPTPAEVQPFAVSEIPAEAERFEAQAREIRSHLPLPAALEDVDAQLTRAEKLTARMLARPEPSATDELQLVELQDQDGELREIDSAGSRLESLLTARARLLEGDRAALAREESRWTATLPEATTQDLPESIRRRVAEIVSSTAALRGEVKGRRDEALTLLERLSRARVSLEDARAQIIARRRDAQRRLFAISAAPIWRMEFSGRPVGEAARERLVRDARRLRVYLRESGTSVAVRFGVALLVGLAFLFLLRGAAAEAAKADPYSRAPVRLIERPFAAATLGALVILGWTRTQGTAPALFRDAVWVLSIFSTSVILARILGPSVRRSLVILTAATCLYPLRYLFEQDPLLDRIVLLLQCGAVAATFAMDLRAGLWKRVFTGRWERVVTVILGLAILLLTAATVFVVIGYVGPARLLRTGVLGSLGVGLISLGVYALLYGFLSSLLATRAARSLYVVANRSDRIRRFLRRVLSTLMAFQWAFLTFVAFGLGSAAVDWLGRALAASLQIGSATISVSGVLTFLGVLGATYVLASIVRFVLEGEILPRLPLGRGLPYTISTTVRYAILLCGVFLAFSAAGISLSRFSLIAGALGVGLGFGLQNLVSNFVSGLILLFERPIQVGDILDVGSLDGNVTRIGMRSSTILTAEGAEVVVPNADLISKNVINWTLSDRRRRIEIRVGVAYGSDPEKVIGWLLEAASDHPEALTDPAPAAYFIGFGDSSLDFVLHVWVGRFEQGQALQSAVRRAVHRVLAETASRFPSRSAT